MELLYNTRIKKPDISFPTNYSLAPITVIQNTEIAEIHQQQKYWNQIEKKH